MPKLKLFSFSLLSLVVDCFFFFFFSLCLYCYYLLFYFFSPVTIYIVWCWSVYSNTIGPYAHFIFFFFSVVVVLYLEIVSLYLNNTGIDVLLFVSSILFSFFFLYYYYYQGLVIIVDCKSYNWMICLRFVTLLCTGSLHFNTTWAFFQCEKL